jgi:hypothetical protein
VKEMSTTNCSGDSSRRGFGSVQDGIHYLTKQYLSPKRLAALAKRDAKAKAKAAATIELWKKTYCVEDREMGGWQCLDHMIYRDDMGRIYGMTVADMALMLKNGVRL